MKEKRERKKTLLAAGRASVVLLFPPLDMTGGNHGEFSTEYR